MKKVILYGLAQVLLRRKIENFLDDDYEVIGYSDTHYRLDVIDGKTFFPPSQLCELDFDYIVLGGVMESTWESMRQHLVGLGIPDEKIISPVLLVQGEEKMYQFDLVNDIHNDRHKTADGLIFGLSYSLLGINKDNLKISAHDCSYHGLDLYYNFRLYSYILEQNFFQNANTALLVFPYYYFDYDMSRSLYQYETGQIFSIWKLDDWHNCHYVPKAKDYVANYRMFGNKIMKLYRRPRYEKPIRDMHQKNDHSDTLGKIWFTEHKETIKENKEIFHCFIRKLMERKMKICLIIPPIYTKGVDQKSLDAIGQKKKNFYDSLQEVGVTKKIEIFDYTNAFAEQRELFFDVTHLNAEGAKAFTELINKEIL